MSGGTVLCRGSCRRELDGGCGRLPRCGKRRQADDAGQLPCPDPESAGSRGNSPTSRADSYRDGTDPTVGRPAQRGLPVTVHRLGRVLGPARTGYVNERDFPWSVLRAGIPAGIVPKLFEDEVWTPVDFVARSLVHLCLRRDDGTAGVFNHATLPRVRLADVYDWVRAYGYPVRVLPLANWRERLPRSADAAATTLAFFDSAEDGPDGQGGATDLRLGHVRADRVRAGLAGSGITCPPVDRDQFFRCLDHCVTAGALPAPNTPRPAD
ncbi:SDR family oxidoreductase [Streptomyces griseofuscus]|uniref:SDR family oxidoreductase n=1 Tax=Streptomyces griseofuscus TaxID=146922 RepID=UPI000F6554F1|nr:SDR family oxidoreductase [Streptomyces griseofuscus]